MKKLTVFLSIFCALTALFISCKKEKSYEGGAPSSDSLLVKTVAQAGTDSIVYTYGYDASRRLISRNYVSAVQGVNDNEQLTIRRNSQGIILQLIKKSDSLKANGLDSLVYNVHYDAGKSRYTSQVATLTIAGLTLSDSTAYSYDAASGKLTEQIEYIGSTAFGGFQEYAKIDYSYDANNNVSAAKIYGYDMTSGSYQEAADYTYEYDNNVNPLKQLGTEAFLLDDYTLYSQHNVTKQTIADPTDPTNNDVLATTYIYNTQNKPATSVSTYQSSGDIVPTTYYYQ